MKPKPLNFHELSLGSSMCDWLGLLMPRGELVKLAFLFGASPEAR